MSTQTINAETSIAKSYTFLTLFSMCYLSIMFANAILTNRYVGYDSYFILGGTLTSPLIFMLDNIIAEIYGYKITRNLILFGYIMLSLFVLICQVIISMPFPSFFKYNSIYSHLLGSSLLRIDISGFTAYLIANLLNAYIIVRWKAIVKGRYFWLRSLGSSTFAAAIYSVIAIISMEINLIPLGSVIKIIMISFTIKVICICFMAYPSWLLVYFLKKIIGIDTYDLPQMFTPAKYFQEHQIDK